MLKILKNIGIFVRLKLDIEGMHLKEEIIIRTNNTKFVNFTLSKIENQLRSRDLIDSKPQKND